MLSAHTLKVHRRERVGSRYSRRERDAGRLPGVLYGHGSAPMAISLEMRETMRFLHAGEKVFSLDVPGEKPGQTVIVKGLQFDYLGTNVVHIDLARVDLDEQITANVAIRLIGEPIGLKKAGAILTHPNTSLTVRCTVRTLPDHIDLSIVDLDLGQSMHVRDIKLPEGITLAEDPDAIVAAISIAKEEEAPAEAAAVEGAAAQPEVITAKKDEAGKEGEAGAAKKDEGDKGKKDKK